MSNRRPYPLYRLLITCVSVTCAVSSVFCAAPAQAAPAAPATVTAPAGAAASAKPAKPAKSKKSVKSAKSGKKGKKGARKTHKARKTRKLSRAARQRIRAQRAVRAALAQVGDPYRYGAAGPHAFDCSGLTWYAWRMAGVRIPRVAAAQYLGIPVKVSWSRLQPGDLLFFRGLGHVGMYVGKGRWIHAPRTGTRVRVERLNRYRRGTFVGAVRPGF